jgi:hypothetical protein
LTNTKKNINKKKDKTNTYSSKEETKSVPKRRYPKLNQPIKINLISRTNQTPINDSIRKEFWKGKEKTKGMRKMISKVRI